MKKTYPDMVVAAEIKVSRTGERHVMLPFLKAARLEKSLERKK